MTKTADAKDYNSFDSIDGFGLSSSVGFYKGGVCLNHSDTTTENPITKQDTLFGFLLHLITGIGAFLLANALILEGMAPFGVAMVGGVKRQYLPIATGGAVIGYLISGSGGFAYIAALFAVLAIRLILGNGRLARNHLFRSTLVFLAVGITKIAVSTTYGGNLLLEISEASIAATATYFIAVTYCISGTHSSGVDLKETASLTFVTALILLSLSHFEIFGLSPGRILSATVILAAARYGKASYGAVCGTIISFIIGISSRESLEYSIIFAFSGLLCGLFSGLGSFGMIGAYLGTTLLSALLLGDATHIAIFFFEALIGCGIFLLIPRKVGGYLGGILSPPTEISRLDSVKGSLIMRLEFASGALTDIYETVEDVAAELSRINTPDFEHTLSKVEEEVCGGCSLRKHCWETAKEITAQDALRTWNHSKKPCDASKEGEARFNCLRADRFDASVKAHLSTYDSRRAAELRLSEVRGVINDQFEGISQMLRDLSEEFKYEVRHDAAAAENICLALKNLGFHAIHCIAARDKFDRLSADIRLKGVSDHPINKMEIVKHLSAAVGRNLDTPSVSYGGDEAFLFLTERPVFNVELGLTQIPEASGKLCGDSCKYFRDGRGRLILLLSDGMGTGGRAAVDSAMVSGLMSRMLRSGFGYDCSLKIINSSMLFKSTDESIATVDIAAIDLFHGGCELRKAGAAPTYVRRSGKVGKAESNSLPPGILRDVAFDKATLDLKNEDILVMVSDGVTTEGDDWICNMIRAWNIGSAQQLADEIALAARRRRSDGHSDDISVMVAILKKQ